MLKAAFFDVDGTLLSHELGGMCASAVEALKLLQQHGVKIFTATGRGLWELRGLDIDSIPFDGYVTMNGQMCLDRERNVLFSNTYQPEDKEIVAQAFLAKNVPIALVEEGRFYVNFLNETAKQALRDVWLPTPPKGQYHGGRIQGAVVYDSEAPALGFVKKLRHCRLSQWHPNAYDIIPLGGGKAMGIRKMLDIYGIEEREIAVFGDADNDMEMMEMAGISVAMGNASEAVKQRASFVTADMMDDGVYKAVTMLLGL